MDGFLSSGDQGFEFFGHMSLELCFVLQVRIQESISEKLYSYFF